MHLQQCRHLNMAYHVTAGPDSTVVSYCNKAVSIIEPKLLQRLQNTDNTKTRCSAALLKNARLLQQPSVTVMCHSINAHQMQPGLRLQVCCESTAIEQQALTWLHWPATQ
jgi:hypothetical protein